MAPRDRTLSAFGLNVLRDAKRKGFTQEKLAEKSGLDPPISAGSNAAVRNPGL